MTQEAIYKISLLLDEISTVHDIDDYLDDIIYIAHALTDYHTRKRTVERLRDEAMSAMCAEALQKCADNHFKKGESK